MLSFIGAFLFADLLRTTIKPFSYAAYIRELREVGSKFNRILISARTAGFINSSEVQKACDELKISEDKMFSEIRELKNREIKDHLE